MSKEVLTLIGDDGDIEAVEFGVEKTGDGTKTLDELAGGASASGKGKGLWLITAKAATGSIFADFALGDVYPADGDEVPAVGDKAQPATETPFLDVSSWKVGFTAKEVDITLLRHRVMKYRKGKADSEGTIEGLNTLGVTGEPGALLNQFVKVVQKSATGIVVSDVNSHPIYIKGLIRQTDKAATTMAYIFGQIELFGIDLGAKGGEGQAYSSKFRWTGNDPVYYEEDIA